MTIKCKTVIIAIKLKKNLFTVYKTKRICEAAMNLQTLDYFSTLADSRSFTEAAERLNVTQQTLSASINKLEKELGVILIQRTQPIALTFPGEQFLKYATQFQKNTRAMLQEFHDIAGEEKGRMRVGVSATRGHIIMPRAIATFQEAHPKVMIELVEGENEELYDKLNRSEIDLMVGTVPSTTGALVVHHLTNEKIVLLISQKLMQKTYGVRAQDIVNQLKETKDLRPLGQCPFMLLGQRDVAGSLARQAFERSGIQPEASVISTNSETLIALAQRGVGACFLPSELIASTFPNPESAGLHTIDLGPEMHYQISVAWKQLGHTWKMIEEFASVLTEQASETEHLQTI